MKVKFLSSILIFIVLFSCKSHSDKHSSVFPENLNSISVLDGSNIFSVSENKELSVRLDSYSKETNRSIVVVTVDSILPYDDIQKYANALGNYWGVGQKETNNGLVIVFSKPLRQIGIATGLDTEKILTDSICKSVIDSIMVPLFKNKEYSLGIKNGVDSLIEHWNKGR